MVYVKCCSSRGVIHGQHELLGRDILHAVSGMETKVWFKAHFRHLALAAVLGRCRHCKLQQRLNQAHVFLPYQGKYLLSMCVQRSAYWLATQQPTSADAACKGWHPQWGDRCQELVWIGINMDEAAIRRMLDACLLTDEEMALGPKGWAMLDDPLPPWDVGEGLQLAEELAEPDSCSGQGL
eukprot:GHRR01024614.1.p1 GENE.GHRR01024614.1~~GHRR01024614.1.p1  ORF type:complete len:181 (-),score=34.36 GHRR01024614.1:241-783(-)